MNLSRGLEISNCCSRDERFESISRIIVGKVEMLSYVPYVTTTGSSHGQQLFKLRSIKGDPKSLSVDMGLQITRTDTNVTPVG